MKLSSKNVTEVFEDSLFNDGEPTDNAIIVSGIVTNVGFHSDRLTGHRSDVLDMVKELDSTFHLSVGGGWSFMNLCNDAQGNRWTGEHRVMEQLCLLALGLNIASFLLPREMWSVLPGGMPYIGFSVLDTPT